MKFTNLFHRVCFPENIFPKRKEFEAGWHCHQAGKAKENASQARHGRVEPRSVPLSKEELEASYSQVDLLSFFRLCKRWNWSNILIQVTRPDFSAYTQGSFSTSSSQMRTFKFSENWNRTTDAPVVWFVSHCKDYNGRSFKKHLKIYLTMQAKILINGCFQDEVCTLAAKIHWSSYLWRLWHLQMWQGLS